MIDLYAILGVEPDATPEEIAKAYKANAKKAHPDAGGTAEAMSELNEAYGVLKDEEARRRYDETGEIPKGSKLADPDAPAWALISRYVISYITSNSDEMIEVEDLVQGARDGIQDEIKTIEGTMDKARAIAARAEKVRDRITKAGDDGDNVLRKMVQSQIDAIDHDLAMLEEEIKLKRRAVALLGAYGYEHRKMTPAEEEKAWLEKMGMKGFKPGVINFGGPTA